MSRRVKIGAALLLIGIIAIAGYSAVRDYGADWHFRSCEAAVGQGDYDQAKRHLDACKRVWQNSWRCHLWAIRLARLSGRIDEAQRLIWAADFRQRDIPRETLNLESLLLKAQQGLCTPEEESQLREFVNGNHPDSPLLLHALALGYLRLYRLHDAEDCLKLWLEAQPDNVDALVQLGKTYERFSRFPDAVATYRRILKLRPHNDEIMIRTVYLLVLTNQMIEVADLMDACLQKHRDNPRVQLSAGIYRHQLGQVDEAIALLDDLLKQEPRNVRGLLARGKIALQQEQPEAALRYFQLAQQTAPRDYQVLYLTADCLFKLGKHDEASKLQDQARDAQKNLTRVSELMNALQARPEDADVRCEIGSLLISFGDAVEGRLWIESALHFDPNHAAARRALAQFPATKPARAPH